MIIIKLYEAEGRINCKVKHKYVFYWIECQNIILSSVVFCIKYVTLNINLDNIL